MEQYSILHEDGDILVVAKFGALPVQDDKSGDASLQEMLKAGREFAEAAHRIDRRTSGIVVFAKTKKALAFLDEAFREHRIRKTYVACVEREPVPASGRLVNRISFDKRRNVSRALPEGPSSRPDGSPADSQAAGQPAAIPPEPVSGSRAPADAASAVLDYSLACRSDRYFVLDVVPETGRHHQIRAQLAAAGWPIRGDLKYGARRSCKSGRIMLHARSMEFEHPDRSGTVRFEAPFPEDEPLWLAYRPENPASPG